MMNHRNSLHCQRGYTSVELMIIAGIVFMIACIAAWVTHVVYVIQTVMGTGFDSIGMAILMIGGAFPAFPIGVVHGFMLWF